MSKGKPGLVRIGLFNLALRLLASPISFLFSLVVARYLSIISVETFGAWQFIFVIITGYFTIPSNLLSSITSRYTAEGKPVGGIVIINMIISLFSLVIYIALTPFLVSISHYNEPFYFYLGSLLILMMYTLNAFNSISQGRSPRVNTIASLFFQSVRLGVALYGLIILRLSIEAVILAYVLGYVAQTAINAFFVNANLKIDFHVAFSALRKAVVFIIPYVQYILEATLTWVAVLLVRNTVPISYFESALIISNLIVWSTSSYSGLILKLSESKDPSLIETSIKLFSLSGSFFLLLALTDGLPLLFVLRPEYTAAYSALIILSVSNLLRGYFQLFYTSVYMKDQTLDTESREELKGALAKLSKQNAVLSSLGVGASILVMVALSVLHIYDPVSYSLAISSGLLINSILILISSFKSSKELYTFRIPKADSFVPPLSSIIIGLAFSLYPVTPIHGANLIHDFMIMFYRAVIALIPFVTINLAFTGYTRQLLRKGLEILTELSIHF
ncbi:MAG: hypothetical protein QW494_02300 [Metallosphaera sp.]